MVCKNCGKEVPDGADYCEACGAPLEEPVVLKMTKDDIKKAEKAEKTRQKEQIKEAAKQQPKKQPTRKKKVAADQKKWIDIGGYVKNVGSDTNMLMTLVGSLLLYIAPFLNWIWEKLFDVKKKANLFEIGMKSSMVEENGKILALGSTIVFVLAVVVIVIGVVMLAFSAADYIRPLRKFAANPIVRMIPIVLLIIIFVVLINNKPYTQALAAVEENIRLAKQIGAKSNYDGGRGIGPIVYVIGLLLYLFGTINDLLDRKKQEAEHE